ncbi:MAG: hypothetical protein ACRES9_12475 [Gammaproteobacteria bacterium]
MGELTIYHPYGTVGRLPWERASGSHPVDFGAKPYAKELLALAAGIKTFTEGTGDNHGEDDAAARKNMLTANLVLFLGFAFHDLNMKLLTPTTEEIRSTLNKKSTQYLGTAFDISESNKRHISNAITRLHGSGSPVIKLSNKLRCAEFFDELFKNDRFSGHLAINYQSLLVTGIRNIVLI